MGQPIVGIGFLAVRARLFLSRKGTIISNETDEEIVSATLSGVTHYELVAGVVDPGETPLQAAQRELSEETGYEGGEWSLFMTLSPNPTNHNNRSYTFLATGVEKVREQHLEETEDIHVDILDPSQVLEMLQDGEIIQALHAAPLWRYFCQHKN